MNSSRGCILAEMRAARLTGLHKPLSVEEIDDASAVSPERIVQVRCAALNRRDYWMTKGQYPGISFPTTPGSDGSGICDGQPVIIDPGLDWGASEAVQSKEFQILGMPRDGTLAEQVVVPGSNIYPKPEHLTWEEAAAFPLAGLTAYRALFVHGRAEPEQKVLITGVGGGVALTAMQFALAHGMETSVTSGSPAKLAQAAGMGAHHSANYNTPDWQKDILRKTGEFDLIIDSAGGEAFGLLPKLVKPGGRIVLYGGTLGKIQNLSPQVLFWRQISIHGTSMGSPADFMAMIAFVNKHQIRPIVDSVFELDDVNAAIDRIGSSEQFGKVVVRIRT
jgi:NADPH:quinone reductase-like Zn-dependent oxidoreductase